MSNNIVLRYKSRYHNKFFSLKGKMLNKNNLGVYCNLLKLRPPPNSIVSKHQFNELREKN